MTNYSILDLFYQETTASAIVLKEALALLKIQPSSMEELERATQAVHSIWGSATLVGRADAAKLAQVMKDCLIAAQDKTTTLTEDRIEVLIHASKLLVEMSKPVEKTFTAWMSEHAWEVATVQKSLAIILTSEPTISSPVEEYTVATEARLSLEVLPERVIEVESKLALNLPAVDIPFNHSEQEQNSFAITNEIDRATTPKSDHSTIIQVGDDSMMDLFRMEAEAQVTILNDGLLALESNAQSARVLETLMRSAHSIKGAARIVSLDAIVNIAHVMEDCFVAAQSKTITLNPDAVDSLLQAVDLLQGITEVSNSELPHWLATNQATFVNTQIAISAILDPQSKPLPVITTTNPPPQNIVAPQLVSVSAKAEIEPISNTNIDLSTSASKIDNRQSNSESKPNVIVQLPPTATASRSDAVPVSTSDASKTDPAQTPAQDRVVRVNADNLNRIMGLAGESLIEANWLQPYADSMTSLKRRLVELSRMLEQLQVGLDRENSNRDTKQLLEDARHEEQECLNLLSERVNELEVYAQKNANLSDRLYREVITSNMRPFADGVQGFPRMIRDLARKLNKQVKLDIFGKATSVDRDILKKLEAPLTHILRNATDHGIEMPSERIESGKSPEGTIRLEAFHRGGMLAITITDDGKGINPKALRQKIIDKNFTTPEMAAQLTDAELMEFLFLPGFSTAGQVTEISGRGVGLDIAKSMAQEVGGTVRAESHPGKGTSFYFQLPLTLSVVRTLLVEISGRPYAIPLARIDQIMIVEKSDLAEVENHQYFTMNQQNIGLVSAYQVLELPASSPHSQQIPVVVISEQSQVYGLAVDKFLGEHDLVVRPLDPRLGKVPDISATSLLGDGSPVLIVDISDMVRSMDSIFNIGKINKVDLETATATIDKRKRILVVDDSITVREMERKLLENRGYYVDVAVNGLEGWNAVRTKDYDLVVSDIDMPRMTGIELVKQIKNHANLHALPVIIISYRDRQEDRIQGLEAGANYYLTKSSFHDDTLVNAVVDLIGR
jgi:two-component system, chemotaxis family, sensor histidine kinase and response regulator WspE